MTDEQIKEAWDHAMANYATDLLVSGENVRAVWMGFVLAHGRADLMSEFGRIVLVQQPIELKLNRPAAKEW